MAMKPYNRCFSVAILANLFVFGTAMAQQDQTWSGVFLSGKPKKESNLLIWFDGHARLRDGAQNLDTTIIRPGIGWRINDKLDLYTGYALITNYRDTGDFKEQRLWQQANYPIITIGDAKITGRTRLEQRFRDNADGTGWRFRQFIRMGKPIKASSFGLVASNETFLNLNSTAWGQKSGYDQNRLFLGASYQFNQKVRLEGGYLHHHINAPKDISRDNLAINLFTSF